MPLVAKNVNEDSAGDDGDVRVVNLGNELHFGRTKGIIVWDDDVLQFRAVRDTLVCTQEKIRGTY